MDSIKKHLEEIRDRVYNFEREKDGWRWNSLFESLDRESNNRIALYQLSEARKPENYELNRYDNFFPFNNTRILLEGGPRGDYINANRLKIKLKDIMPLEYIVTQGPLPSTAGHFWLMVFQQQCKGIIMLTIVGPNQCHQYWPLGSGRGGTDVMNFEDVGLNVQLLSERNESDFVVRELRIHDTSTGVLWDVEQFQQSSWSDFGVPKSPSGFHDLLLAVSNSGVFDEKFGPPVVHCSAGLGRSGTFCLVDACVRQICNGSFTSVDSTFRKLRKCRMGLVQTEMQLKFAHEAILKELERLIREEEISVVVPPDSEAPPKDSPVDNDNEKDDGDDK